VTSAVQLAQRTRQRVWIVLPAYNEEASLPHLLERIEDSMFETGIEHQIVLVDDGSTDRTLEIANRAALTQPVIVERHPANLGLGATIRDGLLKACELSQPKDVLVTLDADNSHTPELIQRLVRLIREGHDVVIASRYQPGSRVRGVPMLRRIISYWGSWLFRVVFPIPGVRDYTCGYRAYRAGALQRTVAEHGREFFDQEGFQCMVDILLKLRKQDLLFGEAPLILRYDLKEGASKMNILATINDTIFLMIRRRLESRS